MYRDKKLKVEEYQQHIPLFLSNHPSGYVHSVFQNGLNISVGGQLFFIGTTNYGRNPFGIHLPKEAIHELVSKETQDAPVKWNAEERTLIFPRSKMEIDFNGAVAFEDKLEKIENEIDDIPQFESFVTELVWNGEPTGLGIDIEHFLLDIGNGDYNNDQQSFQSTYALMDVLFSDEKDDMENVLRYFIGRGKGLTPSGDDHLVGLLAIDVITGAFSPTFSNTIQSLLSKESLTTDVGREYMKYALYGHFSSDIVHVTHDLFDENPNVDIHEHMVKLLKLGHSSGVDTAFGMLIGMLALRRKKVWEKR